MSKNNSNSRLVAQLLAISYSNSDLVAEERAACQEAARLLSPETDNEDFCAACGQNWNADARLEDWRLAAHPFTKPTDLREHLSNTGADHLCPACFPGKYG